MADDLKFCPGCGHTDEVQVVETKYGAEKVKCFFVMCGTCGMRSDYFAEFVHGPPEKVREKAIAAWNRRARVGRSEELADIVKELNVLTGIQWDAVKKSKAKGTDDVRDAVKQLNKLFEQILPAAKMNNITEIGVDRDHR